LGDNVNLANYRLVISDLDGTLVPYCTDRISERTIQTMAALRENGVEFTVATGRSWVQAKPIVAQLGITCPVIVQAGALVIDPITERPIRTRPLRPELETKLRQLKYGGGVDQFCLAESGGYYTTQITTSGGKWLYQFGENCSLVSEWRHQPTKIIKHLFIGAEVALQQLGLQIEAQLTPHPNLIFWPPDPGQRIDDWFLEVFDPLASKGQALQWLTGQLGIAMAAVIAFGDGGNDLDMLQQAGMGVAIEGGAPEVLSATAYRAGRPEDDGVVRFLELVAEPNCDDNNGVA
jgi:Cof subfamily protein (haloacid dehalogenase superfamily)